MDDGRSIDGLIASSVMMGLLVDGLMRLIDCDGLMDVLIG